MSSGVGGLKTVCRTGWKVYSVQIEDEIIAAAFLKKEGEKLITKNTPIKMLFQGHGYSHLIKEFFEQQAQSLNIDHVVNICPNDNFRMISLNETHGYKKTGNTFGEKKSLIEWIKTIQNKEK